MYLVVLDLIIDTDKMVAIMYFQCYRLRKNMNVILFFSHRKSITINVRKYPLKFFFIRKNDGRTHRRRNSIIIHRKIVVTVS